MSYIIKANINIYVCTHWKPSSNAQCCYMYVIHIFTHVFLWPHCTYIYICDCHIYIYDWYCQLSTHTVATLVKLCSLFLGWANSTLPHTHSTFAAAVVSIVFSFFLHTHIDMQEARTVKLFNLYAFLDNLCFVLSHWALPSFTVRAFVFEIHKESKQARERVWEREWCLGREAREASWLLLSFSVLLFPLLFICFVCCCCCCCLSAVCVGACVRVPMCGAHALWLWKINNNNNQMTLSCNFLCFCCCCCCGGPWLSNNDGTIHAHIHMHTYVCICSACVFLIIRRKYKKLNSNSKMKWKFVFSVYAFSLYSMTRLCCCLLSTSLSPHKHTYAHKDARSAHTHMQSFKTHAADCSNSF